MLIHDWLDTGAIQQSLQRYTKIYRAPGSLRTHCLLLMAGVIGSSSPFPTIFGFFHLILCQHSWSQDTFFLCHSRLQALRVIKTLDTNTRYLLFELFVLFQGQKTFQSSTRVHTPPFVVLAATQPCPHLLHRCFDKHWRYSRGLLL